MEQRGLVLSRRGQLSRVASVASWRTEAERLSCESVCSKTQFSGSRTEPPRTLVNLLMAGVVGCFYSRCSRLSINSMRWTEAESSDTRLGHRWKRERRRTPISCASLSDPRGRYSDVHLRRSARPVPGNTGIWPARVCQHARLMDHE
jgi:hypothetical protein